MLLQRMFSDVDADSEPFRFARMYRACRLRLKQPPYRYEIVQKGVLQLAGFPSPLPLPPTDYESLLHPVQTPPVMRSSAPTLVSVIKEQIEGLAARLDTVDSGLNRVLTGLEAPIAPSRIVSLDKSIQRVVQGELRQMEDRLAQRLSPPAPAPAPAPGSEFALTAVRRLREEFNVVSATVKDLAERTHKLEAGAGASPVEPPAEVEASKARPPQPPPRVISPSVSGSSAPSARAPALTPVEIPAEPAAASSDPQRWKRSSSAPVEPRPAPAAPLASSRAEPPAAKPEGLPDGWAKAVASLGAFRGLGEEELADSLEKMKNALQQLPGGAEIRLVHLKESMGKFQVHGAVAEPGEQVICRPCAEAKTFQAAVCAGEEGAATLHVLLPPGDYAPYNYPAGYHKLIQNVPNQPFHIQAVVSPAVLTVVPGSSPTEYEVQYKLQWG